MAPTVLQQQQQQQQQDGTRQVFVSGRLCLFGEHSDWAGGFQGCGACTFAACACVQA